jgi:uncharacterized membrane protein YqiK
MSFEWISWLGNLVKLIGDLIPQRYQVPPTHRAVKYKRMRHTIVLRPGNHWYIPFFSQVQELAVKRQTIELCVQQLTTKDGKPVQVEGTVTFEIGDSDEEILKAIVETWDITDNIDDEARGVYADFITTKDFDEIQTDRRGANVELTRQVRSRLREYGVKVFRAQLTSFVTGIPLLHINSGAPE